MLHPPTHPPTQILTPPSSTPALMPARAPTPYNIYTHSCQQIQTRMRANLTLRTRTHTHTHTRTCAACAAALARALMGTLALCGRPGREPRSPAARCCVPCTAPGSLLRPLRASGLPRLPSVLLTVPPVVSGTLAGTLAGLGLATGVAKIVGWSSGCHVTPLCAAAAPLRASADTGRVRKCAPSSSAPPTSCQLHGCAVPHPLLLLLGG